LANAITYMPSCRLTGTDLISLLILFLFFLFLLGRPSSENA